MSKLVPPGMPFIAGPPFACEAPFVPGDVLEEASALLEAEALIASWSTGHLPARILLLLIPILLEMASLNTLLSHFFLVPLRLAICQSPARDPAQADAVDPYTSYLTQVLPNNIFPVRPQNTLTLLLPYTQYCNCLILVSLHWHTLQLLRLSRNKWQICWSVTQSTHTKIVNHYCRTILPAAGTICAISAFDLPSQLKLVMSDIFHTNQKPSTTPVSSTRSLPIFKSPACAPNSYFNSLRIAMTTLQQLWKVHTDSLIEIGNNTIQATQQNFISARTCWNWSWEISQQLEIRRVR